MPRRTPPRPMRPMNAGSPGRSIDSRRSSPGRVADLSSIHKVYEGWCFTCIYSIPDFQFFTSNSVRDFKFLMMLNDNFLWHMNLHTDINKTPPYSAENFYITNLYKHWILFCLDTISSSVLVDRTAERNIMTDQTSECDSVSLAFMPLIHNCSHYM